MRVLLGVALVCSGACSSATTSGDDTFPAAPLTQVSSNSGALHVELRTSPEQPPQRGTNSVELTVTDAAGKPADGLTVQVTPWMPAHGHGASLVTSVTALGDGKYVVHDVSFFMPGTWELRTSFQGPITDDVDPTFDVP